MDRSNKETHVVPLVRTTLCRHSCRIPKSTTLIMIDQRSELFKLSRRFSEYISISFFLPLPFACWTAFSLKTINFIKTWFTCFFTRVYTQIILLFMKRERTKCLFLSACLNCSISLLRSKNKIVFVILIRNRKRRTYRRSRQVRPKIMLA